MKTKKSGKKLTLKKITVAHLNDEEMMKLKAGEQSCIPSTCPGCLFPPEDKITYQE